MNYKKPKNLLTTNNTKTVKGEKYGWKTFILYMSPFNQNAKGVNICPQATAGCAEACLFGSGFGGMFNSVELARINKTNYFLANRKDFLMQLYTEITKIVKKYENKKEKICIRLNGTSDLSWEKFKVMDGKSLMELFPTVQFYDYTKNHHRFNSILPANYHLTFSRSEINEEKVEEILARGYNVAVVFDELPDTYKGYTVINGDLSDLRFEDQENVVVGLKYKKLTGSGANNKKAFESGFALNKQDLVQVAAAA
jgi:hypothetical protein